MTGAAFVGLFGATAGKGRPQSEVHATIGLVANILVVMTSLALGLMLNSAKNTFEEDNRNIHVLATDLILLDRTLKALGPPAGEARRQIAEYVRVSLREANIVKEDPDAEALLDAAGASVRSMRFSDEQRSLSGTTPGSFTGRSSVIDGSPSTSREGPSRRRSLSCWSSGSPRSSPVLAIKLR